MFHLRPAPPRILSAILGVPNCGATSCTCSSVRVLAHIFPTCSTRCASVLRVPRLLPLLCAPSNHAGGDVGLAFKRLRGRAVTFFEASSTHWGRPISAVHGAGDGFVQSPRRAQAQEQEEPAVFPCRLRESCRRKKAEPTVASRFRSCSGAADCYVKMLLEFLRGSRTRGAGSCPGGTR